MILEPAVPDASGIASVTSLIGTSILSQRNCDGKANKLSKNGNTTVRTEQLEQYVLLMKVIKENGWREEPEFKRVLEMELPRENIQKYFAGVSKPFHKLRQVFKYVISDYNSGGDQEGPSAEDLQLTIDFAKRILQFGPEIVAEENNSDFVLAQLAVYLNRFEIYGCTKYETALETIGKELAPLLAKRAWELSGYPNLLPQTHEGWVSELVDD